MKTGPVAVALAVVTAAGLIVLAGLRGSLGRTWGDEGTYLAMTTSLALDGDLAFAEPDRARLVAADHVAKKAVILQQTGRGLFYSKPVLYPLLAAPLYRLAGEWGLILLNALALAAALALAHAYLRRLGPADAAALSLVGFAGGSVLLPYLLWKMSDLLQAALALGGLVLCLGALRPALTQPRGRLARLVEGPAAPALGGLALGLLAAMRYPSALIGASALFALALERRWRRLAAVAAAGLGGFLLAAVLNLGLVGAAVPYKAVRASFDADTGYPVGPGAEIARRQFEDDLATQAMGPVPVWKPLVSAYSTLYFFIGRHTGLLLYFPAALALALALRRRWDRIGLALLAGTGTLVAFYLIWLPENYFGGEGFVGNRYFLAAYPALLVALVELPRPRMWLLPWGLAAAVFLSAAVSLDRTAGADPSSQSHASAGLFRLFPYESTALAIDGRRDRYWSHEFVRFVDPYARVSDWSFRLAAGAPPAELQVANKRRFGVMRLVVHSRATELELRFADWGKRRTYRLRSDTGRGGLSAVIELPPSPAWRYHPFWYEPDLIAASRAFRLSLSTPDGSAADADIRYLGRYHVPYRIFDRQVLEATLPARVEAGSASTVRLRVRNRSRQLWTSEHVLPVYLTYRLFSLEGGRGAPQEGPRTPLPAKVRPGEILDAAVSVRWPRQAGEYELVVDLILEGVAWFGERTGEPLARARVRVTGTAAAALASARTFQ